MNICQQCDSACQSCLKSSSNEIILEPTSTVLAAENLSLRSKKYIKKSMKNHIKIIDQSYIESSCMSNNLIGQMSNTDDINDIQNRLKLTIGSITRIQSIASSKWPFKGINHQAIDQQRSMNDKHTQKQFQKGQMQKMNYLQSDSETNMILHKQNCMDLPNKLNDQYKSEPHKKSMKKNHVNSHLQSTKKFHQSPSCQNFQLLNKTMVQHSNRSHLISPHLDDLTSRLIQRENTQLREELHRLKLEEKDLQKQQINLRSKNERQYNLLKRRSEELKHRSKQRKQELNELSRLVKTIKKNKYQMNKKPL